jgi:hypothetical protein
MRTAEKMKAITAATNPTGIPVNNASGTAFGKNKENRTQAKKNPMYARTNVTSAIKRGLVNRAVMEGCLCAPV